MDSEHIEVIDPETRLCPEGVCGPVIGGMITYFDDSHSIGPPMLEHWHLHWVEPSMKPDLVR